VTPLTGVQTSLFHATVALLLDRDCIVVRVCSVKDLLMNVGDQFSKDEVSYLTVTHCVQDPRVKHVNISALSRATNLKGQKREFT